RLQRAGMSSDPAGDIEESRELGAREMALDEVELALDRRRVVRGEKGVEPDVRKVVGHGSTGGRSASGSTQLPLYPSPPFFAPSQARSPRERSVEGASPGR